MNVILSMESKCLSHSQLACALTLKQITKKKKGGERRGGGGEVAVVFSLVQAL